MTAIDVKRYEGLVKAIAAKLRRGKPSSVRFEDLVAYGWLGLVEAAQRFDPNRGAEFSTFAYYRIRGAMLDGMDKMHRGDAQTWHFDDLAPSNRGQASDTAKLRAAPSDEAFTRWREAEDRLHDSIARDQLRERMSKSDEELWAKISNAETLTEVGEIVGISKAWVSRKRSDLVTRVRRIAA